MYHNKGWMTVHVLHLSDLHLRADAGAHAYGRDPDAHLTAVIDAAMVRRSRFDVVAVTGDVADDASEHAYQRAHRRLRGIGSALRWVPGNHDDPHRMMCVDSQAFGDLTAGPWRFICVNSRWAGHTPGLVTPDELARLDRALRSPGPPHRAVLIHHPPRPPCTNVDCQITQVNALLEVLDRHRSVRTVLSGHMHRSFCVHRDHVAWIGAPSVCMQVTHPDHVHTAEPPAANLLELGDDGSVTMTTFHDLPPSHD